MCQMLDGLYTTILSIEKLRKVLLSVEQQAWFGAVGHLAVSWLLELVWEIPGLHTWAL